MQKVKRIGEFIKKNLKWILLFLCTIIGDSFENII